MAATSPMPDIDKAQSVIGYDTSDISKLPQESRAPVFEFRDVFFWRDAPDWYYKTFTSAGFMLSFSALRQYLDRHEIEVFLPPRAKLLPEGMRRTYRNREIFKAALMKSGMQTTVAAAVAAIYFAGAYYLGDYRQQHTWENMAASGTVAGASLALWMIRPPRFRTVMFGAAMGCGMGSLTGYLTQLSGKPFWDERHDFQGWWWGRYIDNKERRRAEAAAAQAAAQAAMPATAAKPS